MFIFGNQRNTGIKQLKVPFFHLQIINYVKPPYHLLLWRMSEASSFPQRLGPAV